MRLNPVLEKLTPYRAGPSLEEIRYRYQLERVSRLSANESPWGPFPEVVEAMKGALDGLNRYPDGACNEVRTLLAEKLDVPEDHMVFGNGSCELLMLLGEVFLGPGRHAVLPHPVVRHVPAHRHGARRRLLRGGATGLGVRPGSPAGGDAGRNDPSRHLQSQQPDRQPRRRAGTARVPRAGAAGRGRGARRGVLRVRVAREADRLGALAGGVPQPDHPADVLEDLRAGRDCAWATASPTRRWCRRWTRCASRSTWTPWPRWRRRRR